MNPVFPPMKRGSLDLIGLFRKRPWKLIEKGAATPAPHTLTLKGMQSWLEANPSSDAWVLDAGSTFSHRSTILNQQIFWSSAIITRGRVTGRGSQRTPVVLTNQLESEKHLGLILECCQQEVPNIVFSNYKILFFAQKQNEIQGDLR